MREQQLPKGRLVTWAVSRMFQTRAPAVGLLQMRWTMHPSCMQGAKAAAAKPPAAAKGKKGKEEDKPLQVCLAAATACGSQAACSLAQLQQPAELTAPTSQVWQHPGGADRCHCCHHVSPLSFAHLCCHCEGYLFRATRWRHVLNVLPLRVPEPCPTQHCVLKDPLRRPPKAVCSVAAAAGSMLVQGYVLEGFPATAAQARLLEKALTGLDLEQEAAVRAGASKLAPPPATAFPDPDRSLVSGGLSVWWLGTCCSVPMIWLQLAPGRYPHRCCFSSCRANCLNLPPTACIPFCHKLEVPRHC